MKHAGHAVTILLLVLVTSAPAAAQRIDRTRLKHSRPVLKAFSPAVETARPATVTVRGDGRVVSLGTIVDPDGFILTKASELKGPLVCETANGKRMDAKIVGVSDEHDLAMLKVDAKDLPYAKFADVKSVDVGRWLISVGPGDLPEAVGVVSVPRRRIRVQSGYLGVSGGDEVSEHGVVIAQVMPETAAARAGIQVGDVITHVDSETTKNIGELARAIRAHSVGETVKVRVLRDDTTVTLSAKLGQWSSPSGNQRNARMNGAVSERRSRFPAVIQHDTVLMLFQCGGPVVDIDGRVVGINIARAGRTESYALPGDIVREVIPLLKKEAELTPVVKEAEEAVPASAP